MGSVNSSQLLAVPTSVRTRRGNIFTFYSIVGRGGYATCFAARANGGKMIAAKTTSKFSFQRPSQRRRVQREVQILATIRHPNIVRLVDAAEDSLNYYIFLEFCPNSSLGSLVKKQGGLNADRSRWFFSQIAGAVDFLHSRRILHGDLKLSNILLNKHMSPIVCDFGFACELAQATDIRKHVCGTPTHMAPEILEKPCKYGLAADVWSLGVMLYALFYGTTPFEAASIDQIYDRIRRRDVRFPAHSRNIPIPGITLILRILDPHPHTRLTVCEVVKDDWVVSDGSGSAQTLGLRRGQIPASQNEQGCELSQAAHKT